MKMTVAVEVVNDSENDSGIAQTGREGVWDDGQYHWRCELCATDAEFSKCSWFANAASAARSFRKFAF